MPYCARASLASRCAYGCLDPSATIYSLLSMTLSTSLINHAATGLTLSSIARDLHYAQSRDKSQKSDHSAIKIAWCVLDSRALSKGSAGDRMSDDGLAGLDWLRC